MSVYPAPGAPPLVANVSLAVGEWCHIYSVTCWCGRRWIMGGSAKQCTAFAVEHHRTHRWVNRWPRLLGHLAWSIAQARERAGSPS